ncbi:single-stranded-DNA-specific exonuclease RecJ [Helicobacter pametensis]|uniref:single-stranded-DNA-specific exonuclease RecJ n=1 Tax=Helicobacter pametensis TaxID=95149 RepID=UPI0004B591A7|nr:single-stranded-DNA-specific exonuclease RecJ [Helicobacter pametensis]
MLTLQEIRTKLSERFRGEKISSLSSLPHPFELKNVQEGAKLVQEAIQNNKKILIVGDYDADGILATAIMIYFFQAIPYPHFDFVIPNRFHDGYGISVLLLERFPQAELIITVDNGITALQAAEFCKENDKTLIITDHHTPKDSLPQALIINPKVSGFAQEDICGALVAWYFCAGIKAHLDLKLDLTPFLELAGIAIISDLMPLQEINRVILKKALKLFTKPHFPFSSLLLKKHKKIDEECIGFYIAPLLNASGRMAQADIALNFLLSQTLEEAKQHYQELHSLNLQRKSIQESLLKEMEQSLIITQSCVIAYGQDWHEGVLGILAGKLVQLHKKSAFVLTLKNGLYQGSGRSIDEINLIKSLQSLQHICEFGGHRGAVGLKIYPNNLETFIQDFTPYIEESHQVDSILGKLHPSLLTHELLNLLESFAPYGEGNPKPIFTLTPMPILSQKLIGKDKNHTLLTLQSPTHRSIKALAFFCTDLEVDFDSLRVYVTQDSFNYTPMLVVQR